MVFLLDINNSNRKSLDIFTDDVPITVASITINSKSAKYESDSHMKRFVQLSITSRPLNANPY